jgi:hypothetical protein
VALGVLIIAVVSIGVVVEASSLGGFAALQVLTPASLFLAGLFVLWRSGIPL